MLVRRRCPYTGVIDFFSDDEPHLAVGSIYESRHSGKVLWWFHLDDDTHSGEASDLTSAESQIGGIFRDFSLRSAHPFHHAA